MRTLWNRARSVCCLLFSLWLSAHLVTPKHPAEKDGGGDSFSFLWFWGCLKPRWEAVFQRVGEAPCTRCTPAAPQLALLSLVLRPAQGGRCPQKPESLSRGHAVSLLPGCQRSWLRWTVSYGSPLSPAAGGGILGRSFPPSEAR